MWLTACSSINVTHQLIIFLQMNKGDVAPQYTRLIADRSALKKFARMNSISKRTFFELNCFGLQHLYLNWLLLIKNSGLSMAQLMMEFNGCLDKAKQAINGLLCEPIMDFDKMMKRMAEIITALDQ